MKPLLFKILRYSGLPILFREVIQRNKVSILMFHDISKATAEKSFDYLSKHYNIIGLNEFLEAQKKPEAYSLPKKTLIITFDDGHIRNYDLLPIFKEKNIPATIFLCAGIVNTNRHFWFLDNETGIPTDELKKVSNRERLSLLANAGFFPRKEFDYPQALTKSQIAAMRENVNFQAHTLFHPCLPQCTDAEAREEIFQSKRLLEQDFGLEINAMAYPNGDYSDRDIKLLKEAGYTCGISVDLGFNTKQTDLFKLKRLSANDTDNPDELIVKASGAWAFLGTLIK